MTEFKESESGQYVHYTGSADERVISKADFKLVGVDHPTLQWDRGNGFHVPVEDISEEAWSIVDGDDDMKLVTNGDPAKIMARVAGRSASTHPLAAAKAAAGEAATEAAKADGGDSVGAGTVTTTGGSTAGGRGR